MPTSTENNLRLVGHFAQPCVPVPIDGTVRREDIHAVLTAEINKHAPEGGAVHVIAPSGYGKTVAGAQFASFRGATTPFYTGSHTTCYLPVLAGVCVIDEPRNIANLKEALAPTPGKVPVVMWQSEGEIPEALLFAAHSKVAIESWTHEAQRQGL